MIGRIKGQLVAKTTSDVLVDVNGVGYEIDIPLTTFYSLGDLDTQVILHTHLVVREDAQLLFGFGSLEERELFRTLIKVNGVGPKLAIAILSGIDAATFAHAVRNKDVKALTGLPGVGKKTAERLIIEMQDRLPALEAGVTSKPIVAAVDHLGDAETALINLGFKPQEASRALAAIEDTEDSVENLIKQALKNLS
jgi:Holliday junction DNA helicase RuvA